MDPLAEAVCGHLLPCEQLPLDSIGVCQPLAYAACSYPFTPELIARLAADTSVLALSPQTLPEAEVTVAALDLLIRDLRRRCVGVGVSACVREC